MTYSYNGLGQLSSVVQGARTSTFAYDSKGYLASSTNALGQTTSFQNDLNGRVLKQTIPDGRFVSFTYDLDGNMTSVTPPGKPASILGYNVIDLISLFSPTGSPQSTLWSYTPDRKVSQVTRPDGTTAKYSYDPVTGQLSQIAIPTDTIAFGYSPTTGQEVAVNTTLVGLAETWDGNLPISSTWSGAVSGNVTWSYDNSFRPFTRTAVIALPIFGTDFASAYNYDADGRFIGNPIMPLTRNNQGLVVSASLYDPTFTFFTMTEAKGYNSFAELVSDSVVQTTGPTLFSQNLTRDNLGRIAAKTESVWHTTHNYSYVYDPAGRLSSATRDGATTTYTYDSNSNRLTKSSSVSTLTSTYNSQDQLLTMGGIQYTYTVNGERASRLDTSSGVSTTYSYNLFGNLVNVNLPDGRVIGYIYDGKSRRVGKTVNGTLAESYIYNDDLHLSARILAGAQPSADGFIYADNSSVPELMVHVTSDNRQTFRVIVDERGTPKLVVNNTDQTIAEQMDSDEFGNILSDTSPACIRLALPAVTTIKTRSSVISGLGIMIRRRANENYLKLRLKIRHKSTELLLRI